MNITLQPDRFSQWIANAILHSKSWQIKINHPVPPKCVLLGAPHTSNWDLISALLLQHASGVKLHWVGKDTIFRPPFGGFMRWLGGIPVNRRSSNNFVQQIVETFNRMEKLVLAIAPEGTRKQTPFWKTGFYYIALGARVPVALGYIDYGTRTVGIGPAFMPSGDIQSDFKLIREFYSTKKGKFPEKQGEIRIREAGE
jgi:1-acyl-sn-glycerol-3-phosphate acyltransferase